MPKAKHSTRAAAQTARTPITARPRQLTEVLGRRGLCARLLGQVSRDEGEVDGEQSQATTNARASPKPRCAADECQHEHELAHAAWTEKTRLEKTVACQKRWEKTLRGAATFPSLIQPESVNSSTQKRKWRRNVRFRIGPPRFWVGPSFDYYRPGPPRRCSYDQPGRGGLSY